MEVGCTWVEFPHSCPFTRLNTPQRSNQQPGFNADATLVIYRSSLVNAPSGSHCFLSAFSFAIRSAPLYRYSIGSSRLLFVYETNAFSSVPSRISACAVWSSLEIESCWEGSVYQLRTFLGGNGVSHCVDSWEWERGLQP